MKRIDSIKYQLEPNGKYMDGLLIDNGYGNIIDINGDFLDEVFHYVVVYGFNINLNYFEKNKNIIENLLSYNKCVDEINKNNN